MEDLILVRRKRNGQFRGYDREFMKVETSKGRFVISEGFAKKMNLKHGDAVMFAISKSKKQAYIFKEKPEHDNYHIKHGGTGRNYYRFTSTDLAQYLRDTFGLPKSGNHFFELNGSKNNKGYSEIVCHKSIN